MQETVFIRQQLQMPGGFIQPIHLGDVLVILTLLYNRAIAENRIIEVFGPPWVNDIFNIFNYKNIHFGGNYLDDKMPNVSLLDLMPRIKHGYLKDNKSDCHSFVNSKFCYLSDAKIVEYEDIQLPKHNIKAEKENTTLFQFDNRSYDKKISLSPTQIKKIITKFKHPNSKIIGIGGKDTKKYLNYEFILGNLQEISKLLCACQKFIGVDSGISHLAGTLGVRGEIININREPMNWDVIKMYNIFYPTLKNYTYKELKIEHMFL